MTRDPYGEFYSPYLGMGNNPISTIDPDGGCTKCPENAKKGDTFIHPDYDEPLKFNGRNWIDSSGNLALDGVIVRGDNSYSHTNFFSDSSPGSISYFYVDHDSGYRSKYFTTNFELNSIYFNAYNNTGKGKHNTALDVGVKYESTGASIKTRLGTKDYNVNLGARGSMLSAKTNLALGWFSGERKMHGFLLDANAGAYVIEGDYTTGVTIMGTQIKIMSGASAVSAHAGLRLGAYIDDSTNNFVIEFKEHLGWGIGEKFGFKVSIPLFN